MGGLPVIFTPAMRPGPVNVFRFLVFAQPKSTFASAVALVLVRRVRPRVCAMVLCVPALGGWHRNVALRKQHDEERQALQAQYTAQLDGLTEELRIKTLSVGQQSESLRDLHKTLEVHSDPPTPCLYDNPCLYHNPLPVSKLGGEIHRRPRPNPATASENAVVPAACSLENPPDCVILQFVHC